LWEGAYIALLPIDGVMFRKLLKPQASVSPPAIPSGQRVYAVGDVHGCLSLLERLLAAIDADDAARGPALTTLIFLGDLVDRGPGSAGVVERVRQLAGTGADVRLLLGNHEEVFLAALEGDLQALKLFCRIGGRETALSYGITSEAFEQANYEDLAALLSAAVPVGHRALLMSGTGMEVIGDYAFVHAGVHPGRMLDEQRGADLRWIREPFLNHRKRMERVIVHGHTIADEVEFCAHRIGVDTGAYLSGRLSAIGLEGSMRWVIGAS
jgi:serine/threonine protein phosphatase 1